MAARAIWKGTVRLGDFSVPVKLYAAIEEKSVHFRLLHGRDMTPVKQEMVSQETGEVVPAEEIRHGFETGDGRMVILGDADLQGLDPEPSRDITIVSMVPGSAIDHRWYERPYFLGPDGDPEGYSVLTAGLKESGNEALARWVMRNKEYFGVLQLQQGYPVLVTLRHTEEVVPVSELHLPSGREADPRELAMAEQLVAALADRFDPAAYRDEYRERVLEMIAAKASGKVVALRKAVTKGTTRDLKKALEASLKAAGER
jgi:DNA end-binding protein Ku